MARDIVCDKAVDEDTAREKRLISRHKQHSYCFCSAKCKEEFDAHPGQYTARKPIDLYAGTQAEKPPPEQHRQAP